MTPDDFAPLDAPQPYIYVNGIRYAFVPVPTRADVLWGITAVVNHRHEAQTITDADRDLLRSMRISPE